MQVLVLGAGQLARMMSLAGAPLNIDVFAYDVRTDQLVHPLTLQVLGQGLEQGIEQADVITAEFEHITPDILEKCQTSGKFYPNAEAILTGGDRRKEKKLLEKAGINNAPCHIIKERHDFESAIEKIGFPMILKSALDGYDGKGQWRLQSASNADSVWAEISEFLQNSPKNEHQAIIAEKFIHFDREVSLIGVRSRTGEVKTYTLTENIHSNGILSVSIAVQNAPELQHQAERIFGSIATSLGYVGVLAIEFFELDGTLIVNEIAPRVHNSGHWTQQGAEVCQFENHLRSVCGLPLGSTNFLRPTAMINIVGKGSIPQEILKLGHVHWYKKEPRPGRKTGHINVVGEDKAHLKQTLTLIAKKLQHFEFPGLSQAIKRLSV